MTAKSKKDEKIPFEKSLEDLEAIVEDLESGDKGLEESLTLFENGVKLSKELTTRLDEVKHRVEVLTKKGKGKFESAELTEEDS
ncbi:MAG: exodeoxyribonuclease VII small subunit [Elusimicrobiota bacterium]